MDLSRLHYLGLFQSPVSWAKVNREFVTALDRAGVEISATPLKGLHYNRAYPLPERLEECFDRARDANVEMAMEYPENLWKLEGDLNVSWVLYETDLPDHWVEAYREQADVYVCPSTFVRNRALEAGLDAEKTIVVPLGVNMNHYEPAREDGGFSDPDPFRFLTVGPPHKRKGFRELIRGYVRAFSRTDPVTLHIKTYDRASDDHLYPWEFDLDAFIDRVTGPDAPDVLVDRSERDESGMAQLFRRSDVFVLASYGEAFGLSILESMAVGTPVVGMNYGPPAEMINDRNGWLIDGEKKKLTGVAYDQEAPCTFCVPSPEEVGEQLQAIVNQPGQIRDRRSVAIETARRWSWDRSVETFMERMRPFVEDL